MNTRTENIDGCVYCAYCGKELRNYHNIICTTVSSSLVCNCEKAKEELGLYKQLENLYKYPLADSIIEIKVNKYRDELKGITKLTKTYTTIGGTYTHA